VRGILDDIDELDGMFDYFHFLHVIPSLSESVLGMKDETRALGIGHWALDLGPWAFLLSWDP